MEKEKFSLIFNVVLAHNLIRKIHVTIVFRFVEEYLKIFKKMTKFLKMSHLVLHESRKDDKNQP